MRAAAGGRAEDALTELLRWDGDYDETRSDGTVDPGVATWEEYKDRAEKIALRDLGGKDARLLSGEPGLSAPVRHLERRVLRATQPVGAGSS